MLEKAHAQKSPVLRMPKFLKTILAHEAGLTGILLYLAACPVAIALSWLIHPMAFFLWSMMWLFGYMPRGWRRTGLLICVIPVVVLLIAQLVAPPAAPFFMLVVLVLAASEQVQDDGRPGAFNFVGIIFPALCALVLSSNIFLFLLLVVSVTIYVGVLTLRLNRMPLSGLRIRLLPVIMAVSGSLFFAVAGFVLLPRIDPGQLPGFQTDAAETGVGDELDMGRFSQVIANGADAFRAFMPAPLEGREIYWRVYALTNMQGAKFVRGGQRATTTFRPVFLPPNTQGAQGDGVARYTLRHDASVPDFVPVLGVPAGTNLPGNVMFNAYGEVVSSVKTRDLPRELEMSGNLSPAFEADLPVDLRISGQERIKRWARQRRAELGSDRAFIAALMEHFRQSGFTYSLAPQSLASVNAGGRVDTFFFETKRGYCSHYAIATVTALRAAGIPAHIIVGYTGGEWNAFGNYYRVRQSDAHAWVEMQLSPGLWQRLDPTQFVPEASGVSPVQTLAREPGRRSGWQGQMARALQRVDAVLVRLNSDIVLYDEQARRELLSGDFWSRIGSFFGVWVLGTLAFVLPLGAWRYLVRRDPMVRLDRQFARLAKRDGLMRAAGEGRLDFARRWAAVRPAIAEPAQRFADIWCAAIFAPNPPDDFARKLAADLRSIRAASD